MTHQSEHVIIRKVTEAVNAVTPTKRWHLAAIAVAGVLLGKLF